MYTRSAFESLATMLLRRAHGPLMLLIWHLIRLHSDLLLALFMHSRIRGCRGASLVRPALESVTCLATIILFIKSRLGRSEHFDEHAEGVDFHIACRIKSATYTNAPAAVETLEDRRVEWAVSFALCTRSSALALPVASETLLDLLPAPSAAPFASRFL